MLIFIKWSLITVAAFPYWGSFLWCVVWQGFLRPRLIPDDQIARLADQMIAEHGSRAVEMAFMWEDRAWRYSDEFEQGKWRRVRRELKRRAR